MIKTFIIQIVVAIFTLAVGFYYFRDQPDIRYVVTDSLPVAAADGTSKEFVQQINVGNSGSAEGKKIYIKIPAAVSSYELIKHSSAAKEDVEKNKQFELIYSELPPQARFQLTVRYSSFPLAQSNIEVGHQGGKARSLQDSSASFWYYPSLILFALIYLVFIFVDIKKWKKTDLLDFAHHKTAEELISKGRPWFVSKDDWPSTKGKLIGKALQSWSRWDDDIRKDIAYYVLSRTTIPSDIQESVWMEFCQRSEKILAERLKSQSNTIMSIAELKHFLAQRPEKLSEATWEKCVSSAVGNLVTSYRYVANTLDQASVFLIEKEKLREQLPSDIAIELIEASEKNYLKVLLHHILTSQPNLDGINNEKLEAVAPRERKQVLTVPNFRTNLASSPVKR